MRPDLRSLVRETLVLSRFGGLSRLAVVMALLLAPASVFAQINGHVRTEAGAPIPNVEVDLWGSDGRIAVRVTDAEGAFRFPADQVASAQRLSFSHIGYGTEVVPVDRLGAEPAVVLEPLPIPLPGLTVVAAEERCPARDDPVARALWKAASDRYARDTGSRGGAGRLDQFDGWVMDRNLGSFDAPDTTFPGQYSWGPSAGNGADDRLTVDRWIRRAGYAWKPDSVSTGRRILNWVYADLDGKHAHHFATATFGELHAFTVVARTGRTWVLGFCPVRRDRPRIRGTLRLSADTLFLDARWSWTTPAPREDAGAEVVFASHWRPGEARPHLVAARSLFWRHDGRKPRYENVSRAYFQQVRIWEAWAVSGQGERRARLR